MYCTEKIFVFGATILLCISNVLSSETAQVPEDLIERLIESERKIKDIQVHLRAYVPEKDFTSYEYDWGYAKGKEFFRGRRNFAETDNIDDKKIHKRSDVNTTFNGERMFTMLTDLAAFEAGVPPHGAIKSFNGSNFFHVLSPNILMGFGAHEKGRLTLGQAIKQSRSYSVKKEIEIVDSHPCYVVEAIGVEQDPEVNDIWWDVKVWLDCERDLRPLRFEKCHSIDGPNRWKAVNHRIDQIELRQIDGVWLPVAGRRSYFWMQAPKPPESMSAEEFYNLPVNDRNKLGVISMKRSEYCRQVIIDPNTVRLNKGIPDSEFIIDFPLGCKVWDEFIQLGYKVGATNSTIHESFEKDLTITLDSMEEDTDNESEQGIGNHHEISQDQQESTQEDRELTSTNSVSVLAADELQENSKSIYLPIAIGVAILLSVMIPILYLRRRT